MHTNASLLEDCGISCSVFVVYHVCYVCVVACKRTATSRESPSMLSEASALKLSARCERFVAFLETYAPPSHSSEWASHAHWWMFPEMLPALFTELRLLLHLWTPSLLKIATLFFFSRCPSFKRLLTTYRWICRPTESESIHQHGTCFSLAHKCLSLIALLHKKIIYFYSIIVNFLPVY